MKVVFADTFYWIALTLPGDAAYALTEQITDHIVTTEEVLTEYLTFFCASPEYLRRRVAANGLQLYKSRPDKGYSLTDCISMQTMRREGITEALTNHRHFSQEGFKRLFIHV